MKFKVLGDFKKALEKIDYYRDQLLFLFIKPCWPKKITPNSITFLRIIIGVVLFVILFFYKIDNKTLIISLFSLGVVTDLFDGSVARGKNMVTEFGAMLDPIADRLLIIPIAVYSLFTNHKWLLLAFLLTEVINALVSVFYKSKDTYTGSNIYGKTKMALQCIVFISILINWPDSPSMFFIYGLWIAIPFAFFSMFSKIIELKNKNKIYVPKFKNL